MRGPLSQSCSRGISEFILQFYLRWSRRTHRGVQVKFVELGSSSELEFVHEA